MSKSSATKVHRLFSSPNQKRAEPIKPKGRHTELCQFCDEPMAVADGQMVRYHAKCRSKVRNLRKQGKSR